VPDPHVINSLKVLTYTLLDIFSHLSPHSASSAERQGLPQVGLHILKWHPNGLDLVDKLHHAVPVGRSYLRHHSAPRIPRLLLSRLAEANETVETNETNATKIFWRRA
jgi:hypothetical protein